LDEAGKSFDCPIIVGLSEGERKFMNSRRMVNLIKDIRNRENYPIFINADHTHDIDGVKMAIDDGFDSIVVDGSKLSIEDNINFVKEARNYAKKVDSSILIEGEIGFIGDSSKMLDEAPVDVKDLDGFLTKVEDAKRFVSETKVDLFSPSLGTIHGMMRAGNDPQVSTQRISEIKEVVDCPLVLHGGSGTNDEVLEKSVKAGISVVHISTELRLVFRQGLSISLSQNLDEIAPNKYMNEAMTKVKDVVCKKLKIFGW
jgi:fructose-bisphosphate aldolase class II